VGRGGSGWDQARGLVEGDVGLGVGQLWVDGLGAGQLEVSRDQASGRVKVGRLDRG
jgi:hypothetical protein